MTLRSMNRWTASLTHLGLSILVALIVVSLVTLVWYPGAYFAGMGGETLLRLLIGVDVVLGPLITLIIFDPAKPRLKLDLAIVAVLQFAAISYGGFVMFEARPVYTVFVKDRFEVVAANAIDSESLAKGGPYASLSMTGPRVVGARPPADADEKMQITLQSMAGGPDLANLPHRYVPYRELAADAAAATRPLSRLAQGAPDAPQKIQALLADTKRGESTLGFVPVRARNSDFAAVLDRTTGELVGFVGTNPW